MDLEARGISCDAHSAVGEKLLPLPRPEGVFGCSYKTAEMGTRGVPEVCVKGRGWVQEAWRGLQHSLASSLCREGRGTCTGKCPTPSPPSLKGISQRRGLKQLVSGKKDIEAPRIN